MHKAKWLLVNVLPVQQSIPSGLAAQAHALLPAVADQSWTKIQNDRLEVQQ